MSFAAFTEELLRYRERHHDRSVGGLIVVEQVDSTQLLARRIIEDYHREGNAVPAVDVVAWRQAAGRGRHGRSWSSPPGHGVYATLLRRLADPPGLQSLPLRVGVALCRALNRHLEGRCRLKWPNDLLVGGLKLGGILIEAVTAGGAAGATVAIGFGVNVGGDLAAFGEPRATSLRHEATKPSPSLAALARELVDAIDDELGRERSTAEVVARYEELSSLRRGDAIHCRLGDEVLTGSFLGFDEQGFLRLESGGGERVVTSGEVWSRGG